MPFALKFWSPYIPVFKFILKYLYLYYVIALRLSRGFYLVWGDLVTKVLGVGWRGWFHSSVRD